MSTPSLPDEAGSEVGASAKPLQPDEVDFAAVARVSTQAVLKNIRLRFLHADFIEANGEIPPDWTRNAVMGFSVTTRLDRPTGALAVECGFLAMYVRGGESDVLPDPKDAPVELTARFELSYELPNVDAVEDRDPEHFALANGVLHAWPYWRELAHSTTARMGLAPLVIGTFKIPWAGDPTAEQPAPDAERGESPHQQQV